MLRNLIAAYLNSLKTEAEFYEPFQALLRARGFRRVHLIHGAEEHGKDVIGQLDGRQWLFQLKHGDIGLSDWKAIQPQCEEMFYTEIGHPGLDVKLPKSGCLVLTGRLRGSAPGRTQQYAKDIRRRRRGQFEVWEGSDLSEKLEASLPAMGSHDFSLRYGFLSQTLAAGGAGFEAINTYTYSWFEAARSRRSLVPSIVLEACIASRLLDERGLELMSPYLLLGVLRVFAALMATGKSLSSEEKEFLHLVRGLFVRRVISLAEVLSADESAFRRTMLGGINAHFALGARALLLAELAALAVELAPKLEQSDEKVLRSLFALTRTFSALHRIPSDRYAVSLLLIAKRIAAWEGASQCREYVQRAACHLNDFLQNNGAGLAGPYAEAEEEVWRFMAAGTKARSFERRLESFAISACLDSLRGLGDEKTVEEILQDTRAVGGIPMRVIPAGGPTSFFVEHADATTAMLHGLHSGVKEAVIEHAEHISMYHKPKGLNSTATRQLLWAVAAVTRDRWWPALLGPKS